MTDRFVEVNISENNKLVRVAFPTVICPVCEYPMKVLAKHENNVYKCYCPGCQTDRYIRDISDAENKRFNIRNNGTIKDNLTGRNYVIRRPDDMETLIGILNEYDKEYDSFVDDIFNLEREKKDLETMVDFYKDFQKDARELEEENERLKRKNSDLNDILLIQKGIVDDWEIDGIETAMKILCDLYFSVSREKEQLEQKIKEYKNMTKKRYYALPSEGNIYPEFFDGRNDDLLMETEEVVDLLNENEQLKDVLGDVISKNQKLELEIIRLETIIKTGDDDVSNRTS